MSHRSLYRTYRPQSFGDVVGQGHITRTLRNAVVAGTVAHAYLFTGPRGTGKTTTARILAKALDCEKGPTPDPDNTCEDCIEIAEGRHPDVYELDAASRTGVDAVREEIIGRVNYAPTRGKWKVYIIDEVHMLSTSAFNALLKTLEEPPTHTVFVLCTTHPHKVPETIHSRCQRFDFHRIGAEDIAGRLRFIADKESIKVADAALSLIAKHAAGGMRDAITTLEQLAAFTGDEISLDDVEGLLGEVDTALLFECSQLIADRDVAGLFRFVARLAEAGVDLSEFARELAAHVRDLYVVCVVGEPEGIVDATADDLSRLASQTASFTPDRLARALELLAELGAEVRRGTDARLALEVALTRMARPAGDLTIAALAERLEALESNTPTAASHAAPSQIAVPDSSGAAAAGGVRCSDSPRPAAAPRAAAAAELASDPSGSGGASSAVAPKADARADSAPSVAATPTSSATPATEPITITPSPSSGSLEPAHVKRAWPAVLAEFKKLKASRSYLFANTDVDVDGDELVVEFSPDAKPLMEIAQEADTLTLLRRATGAVLGVQPPVRFQLGRGSVQRVQPQQAPPAARAEVRSPDPIDGDQPAGGERAPAEDAHAAAERALIDELGAELIHEHTHDEE